MDQCPKCLGVNISGPKYERDRNYNEHLAYTCCACGYVKRKPTADSYDKGASPCSQKAIDLQRALAGNK